MNLVAREFMAGSCGARTQLNDTALPGNHRPTAVSLGLTVYCHLGILNYPSCRPGFRFQQLGFIAMLTLP